MGSINTIKVLPNPTTGILIFTGLENKAQINVYDLFGAVIYTGVIDPNNAQLDLSAYRNGMYFIRLNSSNSDYKNEIFTNKIILTK
jgi:hypothetical protein